jgi:hypothetical protein
MENPLKEGKCQLAGDMKESTEVARKGQIKFFPQWYGHWQKYATAK